MDKQSEEYQKFLNKGLELLAKNPYYTASPDYINAENWTEVETISEAVEKLKIPEIDKKKLNYCIEAAEPILEMIYEVEDYEGSETHKHAQEIFFLTYLSLANPDLESTKNNKKNLFKKLIEMKIGENGKINARALGRILTSITSWTCQNLLYQVLFYFFVENSEQVNEELFNNGTIEYNSKTIHADGLDRYFDVEFTQFSPDYNVMKVVKRVLLNYAEYLDEGFKKLIDNELQAMFDEDDGESEFDDLEYSLDNINDIIENINRLWNPVVVLKTFLNHKENNL